MDRFDTLFGNRYFEAHDAWRRTRSGPRCWREAFTLLDDPGTIILDQFGGRTDERILDFSIRRSRQEAWNNAVLLANHPDPDNEDAIELLDVRTTLLARLVARPGGLVRPAIQLIKSAENDDVPAVIAHLDSAMPQAHG